MSYLDNLEQDYVLGDLEVYREFDSSHFISNAKSAITNKVEAVNMKMKFDYYSNMIQKASNSFSAIKIDKEVVKQFFSTYNDSIIINKANVYCRDISYREIGTFKPQFITQYINMVQVLIDNVIKGEANQSDINRFMSGVLVDKVQAQVVDTKLTYGVSPKELIKQKDFDNKVKVDTVFVKTKVMPFINNYGKIKQDTLAEASSVVNSITQSCETIKAMFKAVENIKASNSLDFEKVKILNQVSYNTLRGIIDIISYVSFLMIRKINTISSNVIACNQLYIDLSNYFNTSVTESTFEDGIIPTDTKSLSEAIVQGNVDAFIDFSGKIYDFHKNIPTSSAINFNPLNPTVSLAGSDDMELSQDEYNKSVYNDISKGYLSISSGLDILGSEGDDYLLLFDDIIKKSGFSVILEERFQNEINNIVDLSEYESSTELSNINGSDLNIQRRVLAELKDYGINMQTIANIVNETYKKIQYLANRFDNNINGEYRDIETVNQIKIFLKSLKEQFVNMTDMVVQNFFKRLKELGNILTSLEVNDKPEIVDDVEPIETSSSLDISESVFESILSEYEEDTKSLFEALESAYYIEKSLELRGVNVVFEEEHASTNNPSNTANDNANNAKPSTKVTIVDNDKDSGSKATSGPVSSNMSKFIEDIMNKLMLKIKSSKIVVDGKPVPVGAWIGDNKEGLVNRSYNNVSVNILPYHNITQEEIMRNITGVKNAVKGLTQDSLATVANKDGLYKKLFTFTNITDSSEPINEQLTKYFKVKDANLEVVPLSNGELKTQMRSSIIPFCEKYVGNYKTELESALKDLASTVDQTIASYNTNNNANNSGEPIATKAKWVAESTKKFSGSILNANRDRYGDYLKILTSLAPRVKKEQPVNEQNKEQEQNQQETK